uniref:Proteasome endopeptidase complex n=1 Tax=Capra hircus TaxID=9925 RepID=A0A452DK55_CAPHI
ENSALSAPSWGPEAIASDWENREVSTGTTVTVMQFAEGVVLGTDCRSTTGSYITYRVSDMLTPICSAADTQAVADGVNYQLGFRSIELNEPLLVYMAANLFKEMYLMTEIIIAGWNPQEGGSMIVQQSFATGGSGSSYIFGCVSATQKEGMTKEECLQFTASALTLEMEQDGSSGGVIHLAAIEESRVEWQVLLGDQSPKFTNATLPPL